MSPKVRFRLFAGAMVLVCGSSFAQGQTSKTRAPGGRAGGAAAVGGQTGQDSDAEQAPGTRQAPGQGQGPPGGGNPFGGISIDPASRLRSLRTEIATRPRNFGGGPGGGGGRGGPMMMGGGGMGGGILGLLLRSVPLQEELGFTPDQKAQIQEINTNAREKMRDLTRDMFQQGGRGQGGRNNNGGQQGGGEQGGQRPNFDPQQFERMQTAFTEMREENDTALKRVLTPKQLKRLNEIRLRILDAFAVAEEDVANDIGLNEEQYAKILEIMEQYDQANFALLREQFQGMGNMFGRGGPGGGGPGGADNARGGPQAPGARGRQNTVNTKGARDDGDGEETPAARPGARSGRAQQQPAEDGDEEPVPARGANRGRGAAGGRGGAAGAAGAGQDAVADGEQPQGGRRGGFNITPEQRDEMNKRISELSAKQDDLDKKAFAAIRKELLAAQRSKFNKMLGADFDLSKLTQTPEWPQGGRRGEDANAGDRTTNGRAPGARPAAKAAESDDEADEAPAKSETPKQQPRSRPQPRVRGGTNSGGQ